jgi:hypothetical protein
MSEQGNLFDFFDSKIEELSKAIVADPPKMLYQKDTEEPNTSFLAAKNKKGKVPSELLLAYEILLAHPEGLTDFELAKHLEERIGKPIRPTTAGARRVELRDKYKVVVYAGFTKPTDSGSSAKAWKIK